MLYHFIFLGIISICGLIFYALLSHLMGIVSVKYPTVYKEYTKKAAFISQDSKFFAEFVLGGMYKHEIGEEDFKYAKRVIVIFVVELLLFISFLIFTFNYSFD
ncbi:hypothetical protein TQ33_1117 [Kangiella geojedonensis]|uniref:Uncharacterized protein n=1 Tax=Kangiella geojedonensis TaxID=914150 RepID=A0A0F6TQW7_9GAMM|nr:hypothetical protein TQ33_1117 [Kangiella geojedonensis]